MQVARMSLAGYRGQVPFVEPVGSADTCVVVGAAIPLVVQCGRCVGPHRDSRATDRCPRIDCPVAEGPLIEASTAGMTSPIGFRHMFPEQLMQMWRRGGARVRLVNRTGIMPRFGTQAVWRRR